jgi:hypothetical protein
MSSHDCALAGCAHIGCVFLRLTKIHYLSAVADAPFVHPRSRRLATLSCGVVNQDIKDTCIRIGVHLCLIQGPCTLVADLALLTSGSEHTTMYLADGRTMVVFEVCSIGLCSFGSMNMTLFLIVRDDPTHHTGIA